MITQKRDDEQDFKHPSHYLLFFSPRLAKSNYNRNRLLNITNELNEPLLRVRPGLDGLSLAQAPP